MPAEARLEARHRRVDGGIGAVDAGRAQEEQREEGRQPDGGVGAVPRAVRSLAGENVGAEPFARDAGALRGDRLRRGVREIAHRLPADGRVRIEQPVDSVHGAIVKQLFRHRCRRSASSVGLGPSSVLRPLSLVLRHFTADDGPVGPRTDLGHRTEDQGPRTGALQRSQKRAECRRHLSSRGATPPADRHARRAGPAGSWPPSPPPPVASRRRQTSGRRWD